MAGSLRQEVQAHERNQHRNPQGPQRLTWGQNSNVQTSAATVVRLSKLQAVVFSYTKNAD